MVLYYDRYKATLLQQIDQLPRRMDLGRFALVDTASDLSDLSNSEVAKLGDYVVRETLFAETNQNVWRLLRTIADSYGHTPEATQPIIQEFNIELTPFERLLNDLLCHLRAIVADPHSSLNKEVMKVNVGRAKRLSTRSYQYLAHHSEDWEKMSVLSPKPRRILHEELIVDFAVYENILLKAFLHLAITYLSQRVKETADITKFFLTIFDEAQFGKTIWGEKVDRREALVGRAMKKNESKVSGETNRLLSDLKEKLVKLANAPLFADFPKRMVDSVVYHDSNVLNAHKHYKYLKVLWLEQMKQGARCEEDPQELHQKVMGDMRVYVSSLFYYTLGVLGYVCHAVSDSAIEASHESLPPISLRVDEYGVLLISTPRARIRVVSLGGIYDAQETEAILPPDTICFCYGDYQHCDAHSEHIYYVNPIDPNSIEYSGQVLRGLILCEYLEAVSATHDFKSELRDFLPDDAWGIKFDRKAFCYTFNAEGPDAIDVERVLGVLQEHPNFKKRNRYDQAHLKDAMQALLNDIEQQQRLLCGLLVCPKCGMRRSFHTQRSLRHWTCTRCEFVCNLSPGGERHALHHREMEGKYASITSEGWGMDLVNLPV